MFQQSIWNMQGQSSLDYWQQFARGYGKANNGEGMHPIRHNTHPQERKPETVSELQNCQPNKSP